MNEKDIQRIIEMTEEERKICLQAAKKRLHCTYGMTLTNDQVQDFCLFRFVSNHFKGSMDEFMIYQATRSSASKMKKMHKQLSGDIKEAKTHHDRFTKDNSNPWSK